MFDSGDVGAASFLDDLRAARAGLGTLPARCGTWSGDECADALAELDRLEGAVRVAKAPLLAARAAVDAGMQRSDRDFADARARQTRSTRFESMREVAGAAALMALPALAAAVSSGAVPAGHLDALGRVAANSSASGILALTTEAGAAAVLDAAQRSATSAQFRRELEALTAAADPDGLDAARRQGRRGRFLTLTHTPDATLLRGRLDPLAGRRLQLALESTGHRPDDDRDRQQALADALLSVADHTLACHAAETTPADRAANDPADGATNSPVDGAAPASEAVTTAGRRMTSAQNRPHLTVVMGIEVFAALRERARAGSSSATASTADGTPLSAVEIAQLLCDCDVARLVVDAESRPVDVGRSQRLFTGPQRRAILARDRRCAWNGCEAQGHWCEAHHIVWWSRGGGSSVDNAVLLCSFHHHRVHELDLTITRLPAGGPGARVCLGGDLSHAVRAARYEFRLPNGALEHGPPASDMRLESVRAPDTTDANDSPRPHAPGANRPAARTAQADRLPNEPGGRGGARPGRGRDQRGRSPASERALVTLQSPGPPPW